MYFNNVLEKLNLSRYREIFKWIDNTFTELVYSLIPRTTNFLGINFIYESHVLERHRLEYLFDEIYLKSLPRNPDNGIMSINKDSDFVGELVRLSSNTNTEETQTEEKGSLEDKLVTYRAATNNRPEETPDRKERDKRKIEAYMKMTRHVDAPGKGTRRTPSDAFLKAAERKTKFPSTMQQRIGLTPERRSSTYTRNSEDPSVKGLHISRAHILGGRDGRGNANTFLNGRSGKDTRSIQEDIGLKPRISAGSDLGIDKEGRISSEVDSSNFGFGQKDHCSTHGYMPFKDMPGRFDPVAFIKANGKIQMFPVVHNTVDNNNNYDASTVEKIDGAIEIFPIRVNKTNRGIHDVEITGIKGLIGNGDWYMSNNTTSLPKGASLLDFIVEIRQSTYDFFEDAQDLLMKGGTFPVKSGLQKSGNKVSAAGFISTGNYKSSPFVDSRVLEGEYSHVDNSAKSSLLLNSSRDISEIGERFISRQNGFIIGAFTKNTERRFLGTDSISFSNLMKG